MDKKNPNLNKVNKKAPLLLQANTQIFGSVSSLLRRKSIVFGIIFDAMSRF